MAGGVSATVLPELAWKPSGGFGHRAGAPVRRIVVHRWGNRYPADEESTYTGVVAYLRNPANRASAHVVYEGSRGGASQLVRWTDYAWTEAAYNPTSCEVESADALWVPLAGGGYADELGLEQLARIVAFLLATGGGLEHPSKHILPPVWSHDHGFCRHADLGEAGGGHTACPTTDLSRWRHFCSRVAAQYHAGGFRPEWGAR